MESQDGELICCDQLAAELEGMEVDDASAATGVMMGDLFTGLALVLAGVAAFGAQQYMLNRRALQEERRAREVEYLTNAYRALYRLKSRATQREGGVLGLDFGAFTRDELAEVERAVFDSVLFGDWEVVDAVRQFENQKTDTGEDDWDPSNLLHVLGKQIRGFYGLEGLGPSRDHPDREDLSTHLPVMYGLITSSEAPNDEGAAQ